MQFVFGLFSGFVSWVLEILNFSVAFFRTEKTLKMVKRSWKSVNCSNEVFWKDIEERPDGKIQQLKNT